jgi:hypothetical protein
LPYKRVKGEHEVLTISIWAGSLDLALMDVQLQNNMDLFTGNDVEMPRAQDADGAWVTWFS